MGIANDLKKKALAAQEEQRNKAEQERREKIRQEEILAAERLKKFKISAKSSAKTILDKMEVAAAAGKSEIEFVPESLINCSNSFSTFDIIAELKKHINDSDLKFTSRVENHPGEWMDVGDYREEYSIRWIGISW